VIIGVARGKGGTGKTTIAANLAAVDSEAISTNPGVPAVITLWTRQQKEATMETGKFSEIKARLAQGTAALAPEDIAWLVKRVEELEKENEWLKKELSYAEYQGEVGF
jgi:hypothetical protein